MKKEMRPSTGSFQAISRRALRALTPLFLFILCVLAQGGCRSTPSPAPVHTVGPSTCHIRQLAGTTASSGTAGRTTVPAGTIPGSFSITSGGEATYTMPLTTVPGRAGVEPKLSLTYDSSGDDGVLGVGFSLAGLSAITRCPQTIVQDGVIRGVRYDTGDKLCLDGKRLIPLGPAQSGVLELRTFPDTFIRILGHLPPGATAEATALSFEVDMPSGLVVEYGGSGGGTPLAPGASRKHGWRRTRMTAAATP